jgi:RNA polymerase subunit RPABC4/transcription elongation factor Spt4
MGKILSEEERRHMLERLGSKMNATRFMALKFISASINQNEIDYAKMGIEMPEFTKSLLRIIEQLSEKDTDKLIKSAAGVCLTALKLKIDSSPRQDVHMCTTCGEKMVLSNRFCTKCGLELRSQKWASAFKLCEKCQNAIDPRWIICSYCGNQLIKKVEVAKVCQFCKKNIEPSWSMCPFCGSKLNFSVSK